MIVLGRDAARGVLAAKETIDDAVGEADEPPRAAVVLGKHPRDAHERQRSLALTSGGVYATR
jgi:hypothetical protein